MYIDKVADSLRVSHSRGSYEYYPLDEIAFVHPIFQQGVSKHHYSDLARLYIQFKDDSRLKVEIQEVDDQPTWTASQSGVDKAAEDLNKWMAENTVYPSRRIVSADGNVTGDFHSIVPLEGTVDLTTCTPLNAEYPDYSGDTIDKYTYGRWTDIEVAAGTLVAYEY